MPLDALCLDAVRLELEEKVIGARIDKIRQPESDLFLFNLRSRSGNIKLLISASPGSARVQLTERSIENPDRPPMFCSLLRKHIEGARIEYLSQPEAERILVFGLDASDELGVRAKKKLVIELLSRNANIILLDSDDRIIDCRRRVGSAAESGRAVLPGLFYRMPQKQDKLPLIGIGMDTFAGLWANAPEDMLADKWLLDSFSGVSPLVFRELCYRAFGDASPRIADIASEERARLTDAVGELLEKRREGSFTPFLLSEGGRPRDFSFMPIAQYGSLREVREFSSFGELLDEFYTRSEDMRRRSALAAELKRAVDKAQRKLERKLTAQRAELAETSERETYRRYGDIVTANIYAIKKGDTVLKAEDFYNDGAAVEIPLDRLKSPSQNAAAYYKRYTKLKSAEMFLSGQISKGERELEYLAGVSEALERAGSAEENELKQELEETGFLKMQKTRGKRTGKKPEPKPLRFVSESGFSIFVGRTGRQNDNLTMRLARPDDIWLHAQKLHGAHVVISCGGSEPDEATLLYAASLAAEYSEARNGGKTAVDYTRARYVKKPKGALPGMVIYTDYKTVMATPAGKGKE